MTWENVLKKMALLPTCGKIITNKTDLLQHPFQERGPVKEGEISDLFACSDEAGSNARLACDSHGDTSLPGTV